MTGDALLLKMIETKDFKIAEDPKEILWTKALKSTQARIKEMEEALIIEHAFVMMAKSKLRSLQRKYEKQHPTKD